MKTYKLFIYTTVRRRPFKQIIEDVDCKYLFDVIKNIKNNGINIGSNNELYGTYLCPSCIKCIKWKKLLFPRLNKYFYSTIKKE